MNRDYVVHWAIGLVATCVWFWGDRMGVPKEAVTLASQLVPAALGHAMAFTPGGDSPALSQVSLPPSNS